MNNKVYCPVCRVSFAVREPLEKGKELICPVCGARLEIEAIEPEIKSRKKPQTPDEEINDRVDTFARLKGYVFGENKDEVIDGMKQKKERYGDFYCPCRFDNVPENICPCQETRMGDVRKNGSCL
ncbi:MAG TPA: hypothetical protein DEF34_04640 [Desulfotomaculum sp.]|nr:MAG: hypothetical protein VR67_10510 [Peptococcaceae bacterium BRH_c8a]KJS77214.1 MAG: hypothetical protein JL56_03800 [Desulfotomaculum sp. BICA1-6]HBX22910.1 hypothetical protein [Desulfotomaculum sp.]